MPVSPASPPRARSALPAPAWPKVPGLERVLLRLFSGPAARAVATGAPCPPLSTALHMLTHEGASFSPSATLGEILVDAYAQLWASHRAEYCYKNTLARRILLGRHSLATTRMLTEFRVGTSKADVVMINGTTTAYEIKTALDSLDRLPGQLTDYGRVFEFVNVVTHGGGVGRLLAVLPEWVGLIEVTPTGTLRVHRAPLSNLPRLEPGWMLDALRRNEYLAIIAAAYGQAPALPNTQIYGACRTLFEALPVLDAHRAFADALRRRTCPPAVQTLVAAAPPELSALCLCAGFSSDDAVAFQTALAQPLSTFLR